MLRASTNIIAIFFQGLLLKKSHTVISPVLSQSKSALSSVIRAHAAHCRNVDASGTKQASDTVEEYAMTLIARPW